MGQLGTSHKDNENTAEYSVYVYHYPDDIEHGQSDWEKKRVTRNKVRAMSVAKKYHDSAEYKKVEIKRKSYDSRYERVIDRTFHVYTSPGSDNDVLKPLHHFVRKFLIGGRKV